MSVRDVASTKTANGAGQQPASLPGQQREQPALPAPTVAPKSRLGVHIVVTLLVLLILGGAGVLIYYLLTTRNSTANSASAAAAAAKARPTPIVAAPAKLGDMPIYLPGVGTAQARNMVVLRTRVDGQLVKVAFQEGQDVKAGDLLAKIDPQPYKAMVEQVQAQMKRDQASLENAKADLNRDEMAKDAIPKQQLDTAQSTVDQLTATIQVDQAQLDNANLQLGYTDITAPISGRVGLRLVDVGNIVHATDTNGLATIAQLQPITVVFTLSQNELPAVQKAISTGEEVPVLAYDQTLQHLLAKGKLAALDNQIDTTSDTFRLKAEFNNDNNALYPNQFVNAKLLADTRKNVVLVPSEAIQQSPESTFVYVIKSDNTIEQRDVTPGQQDESLDLTIVEKGLKAGEMVATEGLDRLEEGTKVSAQTPGAKGAATKPASTRRPTRGGSGATQTSPATENSPGGDTQPAGDAAPAAPGAPGAGVGVGEALPDAANPVGGSGRGP